MAVDDDCLEIHGRGDNPVNNEDHGDCEWDVFQGVLYLQQVM